MIYYFDVAEDFDEFFDVAEDFDEYFNITDDPRASRQDMVSMDLYLQSDSPKTKKNLHFKENVFRANL